MIKQLRNVSHIRESSVAQIVTLKPIARFTVAFISIHSSLFTTLLQNMYVVRGIPFQAGYISQFAFATVCRVAAGHKVDSPAGKTMTSNNMSN